MPIMKYHVQGLAMGLILSVARGSVAAAAPSGSKKPSFLSRAAPSASSSAAGDEDPDNESFKEKEDWWKDPFAMFDDEDEDVSDTDFEATTASSPLDDDDDELLLVEEKARVVPKSRPSAPLFKKQPKKKKPMTKKKVKVHPLVDAQVARVKRSSPSSGSKMQLGPMLPAVKKLGAVLGALPIVQVLASFAFVKVIRPVLERSKKEAAAKGEFDDEEEEEEEEEEEVDERSYARPPVPHKKVKRGGANSNGGSWISKIFLSNSNAERLPPARELFDQVEYLQREVDTLQNEKESVEREYEKTSWQVSYTYTFFGDARMSLETKLYAHPEITLHHIFLVM
jgi:ribosomal protein L12E/L44/L45/RPP1/RPP2